MSSITRKKSARDNGHKPRSGYLTTTEFAKLCGVSRFTIINWTKRGKIKAIRTVGKHYRIPVSEALAVLKTFNAKKKTAASELAEPCQQETQTITELAEPCQQETQTISDNNEECGNCLTDEDEGMQEKTKKKNILYAFGYSVGRGMHVLKKERSKVK